MSESCIRSVKHYIYYTHNTCDNSLTFCASKWPTIVFKCLFSVLSNADNSFWMLSSHYGSVLLKLTVTEHSPNVTVWSYIQHRRHCYSFCLCFLAFMFIYLNMTCILLCMFTVILIFCSCCELLQAPASHILVLRPCGACASQPCRDSQGHQRLPGSPQGLPVRTARSDHSQG